MPEKTLKEPKTQAVKIFASFSVEIDAHVGKNVKNMKLVSIKAPKFKKKTSYLH